MKPRRVAGKQAGFLMIEVLITMFILLIGLLGVVGLQARAQQAENESYQRSQALVLLRDMADRMNANRNNVASYVTGSPLGTGATLDCTAPSATVDVDKCAWNLALLGAAETSGGACGSATPQNCVGAMINARGCISELDATNKIYLIQVVWQGLSPTDAPPSSVDCGKDDYGAEELRRAVTTVVQIGNLG